jgi:hypothetical protein
MQPRIDSSVVLPLPEGSHQQRQLAAAQREAHALERLDPAGSLAEMFHHVDGLEQQRGHRVNTMAGSMRVT